MTRAVLLRLIGCFLLGLWLAAALPPGAPAAGDDPLRESLASNLLQSRAQLRIFRHDDEVDLSCQSRAFVGAEVVSQPRMIDKDLDERKWLERWVLDRCGAEVSYHVFFTEVGEGGAYFSFQEIELNVGPANGLSVE